MTQRRFLSCAALAVLISVFTLCDAVRAQHGRGPWWADGREQGQGQGRGWRGGRGPGGPGHGGGHGRGPMWRGGQQDETFVADRDMFHDLLANHDKITRKVKMRDDGVTTITESDDPEVTKKIQEHVEAMHARVKENRPIRRRDPLFDALFGHVDSIEMKCKKTQKGMKVVETSDDPYVVKLIQAHAGVVSLFVKNGFDEAPLNHEVPAR